MSSQKQVEKIFSLISQGQILVKPLKMKELDSDMETKEERLIELTGKICYKESHRVPEESVL